MLLRRGRNMNEEYLPCEYCGGSGMKSRVKGFEYEVVHCTKCKGKGYFKNEHNDPTRPSHYHTGNIDVIKFGEENFKSDELKGFYRMNVIKYVTRYDKKNGVEDLKKSKFYLDKLKELERGKDERD